jgi:superfamily II DNA or RNA helicase/HKD family nuclease
MQSAPALINPRLVLNNTTSGCRVLTQLRSELRTCDRFQFYVAFANQAGVASLLQPLEDLKQHGIRGQVLLSQYLNFTDPVALKMLMKLEHLEVRISTKGSMHAKGYYFLNQNTGRYIIGSSNWTSSALSTNTELNVVIQAEAASTFAREVESDFTQQFNSADPLTAEFIASYSLLYEQVRRRRDEVKALEDSIRARSTFQPNKMQVEALANLHALRTKGEKKALLISATGTGKTFLSAFDAKAANPKRLLFVVHRENIARSAMDSFERIFGTTRTCGLYTGNTQDHHADFLFSTVQTLSRQQHLDRFRADEFDYIVVDESHRAGAQSYNRFLNHFTPKFLLGMTATPERTDGVDIFRLFNHQIGYEIRLQRALQEEMLCPFHYFGVADLTINGEAIEEHSDFNKLTTPERVNRIAEKATFYGCDDGIVRGLIFCSRNEESHKLSEELNKRGYSTVALDGSTSEDDREAAIRRLEAPADSPEKLDYILTVDIFNEGVDIPQCNQIIMLRPTQSAIIFVQQLGRGLRKLTTKEKYLTVIDFIGNYSNNYLIPIALYGDRSYDKDRIRRLIVNGNDGLPGTSTINFDLVAKERIFKSLNSANTQQLKELALDFNALKNRLGRIPMMTDFVAQDQRDPRSFAKQKKSFYAFSFYMEPNAVPALSPKAAKVLEVYSRDSLNATSLEEPLLLLALLTGTDSSESELNQAYTDLTGCTSVPGRWDTAANSLNLRFLRESQGGSLVCFAASLGLTLIERHGDQFHALPDLTQLLAEPGFRLYLQDLAEYARNKFLATLDPAEYVAGFVRYQKYSRADVFRILGCLENPVAQNVGGYLLDPNRQWCPIFVNYKKDEGIAATIQYEDAFIDPTKMRWFTKSRRSLTSPDVKFFADPNRHGRIPLFVKKNGDEGMEFYFLGKASPELSSIGQTTMADGNGGNVAVVHMDLALDQPVAESLYGHLVS